MFRSLGFYIALFSMIAVIVISNVLVGFPINDWLTWGAFTFPFTFFVDDVSNRVFGMRKAKMIAFLAFPIAFLASWYFADFRIALASGTAFLLGQMMDIYVFNSLRKATWWKAPWISSVLGSTCDTIIFFSVAFAGTMVPWVQLGIGDLSIKFLMATILLFPYKIIVNMILRKRVVG